MALLALLAQRAAMRLVGPMTVDAFSTQLLVLDHVGMAHVAIQFLVGALERELEFLGVIKASNRPHVAVVAVRACGSQTTGVLVIRLVATDAILRNRILQIAATVTISAADSSVLAIEGKSGLARVIEPLRAPVSRVVAVGTLGSLTAFVNVIRHVAADALLRRSLVMLAGMAGRARNVTMLVG